jgi:hypothetical protein
MHAAPQDIDILLYSLGRKFEGRSSTHMKSYLANKNIKNSY